MTDREFPPCLTIRATFYDKDAECYYVYLMGIVDIEMLPRQLEAFQQFSDEIWPYLQNNATIDEFNEDYPIYDRE